VVPIVLLLLNSSYKLGKRDVGSDCEYNQQNISMIVRDTDILYFVALNIDEVIRNQLNPQRV
jgi:hypothetical protein